MTASSAEGARGVCKCGRRVEWRCILSGKVSLRSQRFMDEKCGSWIQDETVSFMSDILSEDLPAAPLTVLIPAYYPEGLPLPLSQIHLPHHCCNCPLSITPEPDTPRKIHPRPTLHFPHHPLLHIPHNRPPTHTLTPKLNP